MIRLKRAMLYKDEETQYLRIPIEQKEIKGAVGCDVAAILKLPVNYIDIACNGGLELWDDGPDVVFKVEGKEFRCERTHVTTQLFIRNEQIT